MKIGFGKRILMFFHWLLSLLLFAAMTVSVFFPGILESACGFLSQWMGSFSRLGFLITGIAFGAIYLLLSIVQAGIIFKRKPRSERGFITVDSSDNSQVRIAISAIEQMVRQSVNSIDGISDMKIAIESADDSIEISINAVILSGRHVPTITMNMQQAIRKFVELNCGVAVKSVAVSINSVTTQDSNAHRKGRGKKGIKAEETVVPVVPTAFVTPDVAEEPVEAITADISLEDAVEPVAEIENSDADVLIPSVDNCEAEAVQCEAEAENTVEEDDHNNQA